MGNRDSDDEAYALCMLECYKEPGEAPDAGEWKEALCVVAAVAGWKGVLEWAIGYGARPGLYPLEAAVRNGRIEVARLLLGRRDTRRHASDCDVAAVHSGSIAMMRLLHKHKREHGAAWSEWACEEAAYDGNLRALRWLRARGAPLGAALTWAACAGDGAEGTEGAALACMALAHAAGGRPAPGESACVGRALCLAYAAQHGLLAGRVRPRTPAVAARAVAALRAARAVQRAWRRWRAA